MSKSGESVTLKTFLSWDCHGDFLYELSEENKLTNLRCKICSERIADIRKEARLRGISGQSLQSLINYVDGVNYIHKSNVLRHIKSGSLHDWAKHKYGVSVTPTSSGSGDHEDTATTTTTPTEVTGGARGVQQLFLKGAKDQYRAHFTTALALVMKERPMSDFESLIELQKKNGVRFVSNKTNSMACAEMVKYLAQALREDMKDILRNCSFFSCEQDGSEARKTRDEKELVYAKLTVRGKPIELLLSCQQMSSFGGVSAENIKAAIDSSFKTYVADVKYENCLVSACADGAAVNLGRLKGALTVLQHERPWLLIIHCSAHRIELAVHDAFKTSSEFEKVNEMMLNLHLLFRNSGKCWRILVALAEKLGVTLQRFPKAAGTRFQVHKYRALKVLIVNYLPLCLFAENMVQAKPKDCDAQQKAKLRGYLNQWLTYQYLASLQLYRMVLRETAHLSYVCQENSLLMTDVIQELNAAGEKLKMITETESESELPFSAAVENDSVTITASSTNLPANQKFKDRNQMTAKQKARAEKCLSVVTESYTLKKVEQGKQSVKKMKEQLIPSISDHIQQRMESFKEEIFTDFAIADHSQWDFANRDYGVPEVKRIATHFQGPLQFHKFSLDQALSEWKTLKQIVQSRYMHFTNKISMWQQIYIHYHAELPHILLIIELILVTPYSSATVERGFSLLNRLLTNSRLCTSKSVLDDLMVLRLNVPVLISCDPAYEDKLVDKAARLYLNSKQRRSSYVPQKRPSSTCISSVASGSDSYLPVPAGPLLSKSLDNLTTDEDFVLFTHDSDSDQEDNNMTALSDETLSSSDDSDFMT